MNNMDVRLGSPVPGAASPARPANDGQLKKMARERSVFISRILGAIFWNVTFQCALVSCIISIVNVNIFHPYKWIQLTSRTITSFRTWFNLLPIAVIAFAEGVLMSRDYVMGVPCVRTRFAIFCTLFQLKSIVIATVNMLSGVSIVLYYSSVFGDGVGVLTKTCGNSMGSCLNERNLFLIIGGLWVGLYSCMKRHIWETHILIFPLVNQFRYPQVKNQLTRLLCQSMREAIPPTFYLLLMYAWLQGFVQEHLAGLLGVASDDDPMKSVWAWMQFSLVIRSFFFSFLTILYGHTMELFFQIFLSEAYHFPISGSFNDSLTLREALASPVPLLQQLGCLDVLHVAERDPARRRELFSLSLPGGHPHNWNGVSSELIKALNTFTSELNLAASDMNRATNGPLLSSPPKPAPPPAYGTSFCCPSPQSPSQMVSPTGLRMRNMSLLQSPDINRSFISRSPNSEMINVATTDQRKSAVEALKVQVWNLLEWIRRKPGINLLFGEIEDARARYLLLHSQHLTWAAQALALLASASVSKDAYGVVQKDIPSTIKALLNLKNALDRLPLYSHKRSSRLESMDIRMKAALSSSLKRSLYIICEVFGPYLHELSISEEVRQQLSGFVSFKEG